jgi:hypothetical protein
VLPQTEISQVPVAALAAKPTQDRFASSVVEMEASPPQPAKSTKTAEATVPAGGTGATAPVQ